MSARRRLGAIALLCVAMASATAGAVPAAELVHRAAEAEAHDDLAGASRALEELVAAGVDGVDVLYDLGTVYTRAERYGEAVWCFERALRERPWSLSTQKNLRATRVRLARRDASRTGRAVVEQSQPWSVQLGELLPVDLAVALTILAECAGLAAWWGRRRARHELARVGATVAMILVGCVAAFGASVVTARRSSPPSAIVLHGGLRLRQSARVDGIPDEAVREGERVDVVRAEGEFVRVQTSSGKSGWLSARDLGRLGP